MAKTTTKRKAPSTAQLQMLADDAQRTAAETTAHEPEVKSMAPEAVPIVYADADETEWPPFGEWLIKQHQHKQEWIAGLAKAAKADRGFPRAGSPDDVRKYLGNRGADPDMFEAVDEAESDWLSL